VRSLLSKTKKAEKANDSKLVAASSGSHKVSGHQYTWSTGDEVSVKAEHLEAMQSLPAFKEA
tara:strand:+ start:3685 stop:3870 length:186 start_codon:yes stop_codon:yes gene_type:complete